MQVFTVEQAAATLAVDTESVRRWLREGRIGGFKAGAAWRVTQADLDAFIERNRNSYRPGQSDDDDAALVAEAEAALDRLARGEETTMTFEEWEQRHDALDG
ncbi:MAG: helix-turn-helix domain-containing protein [Candidatus Contendobacter sp.]